MYDSTRQEDVALKPKRKVRTWVIWGIIIFVAFMVWGNLCLPESAPDENPIIKQDVDGDGVYDIQFRQNTAGSMECLDSWRQKRPEYCNAVDAARK
jgi:hypothetical protein